MVVNMKLSYNEHYRFEFCVMRILTYELFLFQYENLYVLNANVSA